MAKCSTEERVAAVEVKVAESEKALTVAKKEIDRRLEEMNKLREQVTAERNQYLTRDLFDKLHDQLIGRVSALELGRGSDKLTPFLAALRWVGYAAAAGIGALVSWWLKITIH